MKKVLLGYLLVISIFSSCTKDNDTDIKDNDQSQLLINVSNKPWINQNITYGRVEDVDGNVYATIKIEGYEWMTENLKVSRFCNGDSIPQVSNNADGNAMNASAWSYYESNSKFNEPLGKLYNGHSVRDSRNICPCGWRVPSDADWEVLIDEYGGMTKAGLALKSEATQVTSNDPAWYWHPQNYDVSNASGFSAIPGGNRSHLSYYEWLGISGKWWSSTPGAAGGQHAFVMMHMNGAIGHGNLDVRSGFSIRCVRDIE